MTTEREEGALAEEIFAFYTRVMRGEPMGEEGKIPTVAERIKAAEALSRRLETGAGEREALARLDAFLRALADA